MEDGVSMVVWPVEAGWEAARAPAREIGSWWECMETDTLQRAEVTFLGLHPKKRK